MEDLAPRGQTLGAQPVPLWLVKGWLPGGHCSGGAGIPSARLSAGERKSSSRAEAKAIVLGESTAGASLSAGIDKESQRGSDPGKRV